MPNEPNDIRYLDDQIRPLVNLTSDPMVAAFALCDQLGPIRAEIWAHEVMDCLEQIIEADED